MYYGVEGTFGTRSFLFNSDVTAIDKTKAFLSGQGYGMIVGSKTIHAKVRRGSFKTEALADQKLKIIETEGVLNLYPLQLGKKKFRYFEPYILGGVNKSNVKFFGDYLPALSSLQTSPSEPKPGGALGSGHTPEAGVAGGLVCCCESTLPANPFQTGVVSSQPTPGAYQAIPSSDLGGNSDEPATGDLYIGRLNATRATVGFGFELHIPGAHHFVNLFAETKYGFPIAISNSEVSLRGTKPAGQLAVNFGINFGFSR
jgi:hypothetical protein